MLTLTELSGLARELAGTRVLTAYVDARVTDPAMRETLRPALASAVADARARLASDDERAAFDRAARFLQNPVPPLGGIWSEPGWVTFLTAEGPRYSAELPVRVPTIVAWRDGPVVSPFVRALKQHRPVIVVLVESGSARFYRYARGSLGALPEMTLTARQDTGDPGQARRGTQRRIPMARATVATEKMQRRRAASFQRLTGSLAARVAALAGDDGWVLIGGTPEWARAAADALPAHLADRVGVSATLNHDEPETGIAREAENAASALRAAQSQALLESVLESAGALGRGSAGVPGTQRALHTGAVDLLVLSPEFLRAEPDLAEDAIRAALQQGGDVEVLSSPAAEQLDQMGEGIAARLRYPIDGPAVGAR
ncbi:MAG: hypothetical protein ABI785_04655 [Gemmatimonadales bacterium]